jgi:adenylate cyclase
LLGVLRGGLVEFVRPGESDLSGRELVSVGRIALTGVIVAVNLIGAAAVVGVAMFVVPLPAVAHTGHVRMVNVWLAVAYVLIAVPVGVVLGTRSLKPMENWLLEERPARDDEQRVLVRAPLRLFMVQLVLWLIAATLFGVVNAAYSSRLAVIVVVVVSFTGATTATCAYLIVERLLRAAAVRALVEATPERLAGPGVATRELLTWALSTGVPVAGVVALGVMSLAGYSASARQLAVAMVVLGGVALAVGLVSVTIAARATADPIDSVRRAMAQVAHGQFDVRVPVYDGTQIGQLQLGFNNMAGGLAERERIRDVFGTYVDSEVATRILQGDGDLEGEEVEVTVMFLDVRAFTAYAEQTSARVVVATLNRLFEALSTNSSATACWRCSELRAASPTTRTALLAPRWRSSNWRRRACPAGCRSASASTPGPSSRATSAAGTVWSTASSVTSSTSRLGWRRPPAKRATRSCSRRTRARCCEAALRTSASARGWR